jgi:hypothetical protein
VRVNGMNPLLPESSGTFAIARGAEGSSSSPGSLLIDRIHRLDYLLGSTFSFSPGLEAKSNPPTEGAAAAAPALDSIDIGGSLPTLTLNLNEKGEVRQGGRVGSKG